MTHLKEVPAPKFKIGDTVYRSGTSTTVKTMPCPECLGTGKWKVTTPAGAEFTAYCQRCDRIRSYDLPSMNYEYHRPDVSSLTIGSVRIDTASFNDRHVEYMCVETGIGSGSLYSEHLLFSSREEAQASAQEKADELNAKAEGEPKRIEQRHIGSLTLTDAIFKNARDAIWESWCRFRSLRDDIQQTVDEIDTLEDMRSELEGHLSFDAKYRSPHILDALLDALRSGDEAAIEKVLEKFPQPIPKPVDEEVL